MEYVMTCENILYLEKASIKFVFKDLSMSVLFPIQI